MPSDRFVPDSESWFSSLVVYNDHKRFLRLQLLMPDGSEGDVVYCPWQKLTSKGGHNKCVALGTRVAARIVLDRGAYYALEAVVEQDGVGRYYETALATITHWPNGAGGSRRDCGCPLFTIPGKDSRTGEPTHREVHVGDRVEVEIVPSKKKGWAGFIKRVIS